MKSPLERFLKYVRFNTRADDTTHTHPSFEGEKILGAALTEELRKIGLTDARMTEQGYVYASLPASEGCENAPALGLIAHLDTSDAASGKNVRPAVVTFSGDPIPLGNSGRTLDPAVFPVLKNMIGETLVVTDGTTLLGADDKAGIAEIVTALERVVSAGLPHGKLCVAFTPDEEIGEGADFFDIESFGAEYAFTVDGGPANEIEFQNFNAACAEVSARGRAVHPGSARGLMINALRVLFEFNALLPPHDVPEETEGFQGFFHLTDLSGTAAQAQARYLIRDHDAVRFGERCRLLEDAAAKINSRYGKEILTVSIREQYRNMEEIIRRHPLLLDAARDAVRAAGMEPSSPPIRGGTDGANLSFAGLPCPNLGTGGFNAHGEYEFLHVRAMDQVLAVLLELIGIFSRMESMRKNA